MPDQDDQRPCRREAALRNHGFRSQPRQPRTQVDSLPPQDHFHSFGRAKADFDLPEEPHARSRNRDGHPHRREDSQRQDKLGAVFLRRFGPIPENRNRHERGDGAVRVESVAVGGAAAGARDGAVREGGGARFLVAVDGLAGLHGAGDDPGVRSDLRCAAYERAENQILLMLHTSCRLSLAPPAPARHRRQQHPLLFAALAVHPPRERASETLRLFPLPALRLLPPLPPPPLVARELPLELGRRQRTREAVEGSGAAEVERPGAGEKLVEGRGRESLGVGVDAAGGALGEEVGGQFIEVEADVVRQFGGSSCCLLPQE